MKLIKLSKDTEILLQAMNTRSGFKHEATLFDRGMSSMTVKCCYQNRTWEAFEYQPVLSELRRKVILASAPQKLTIPELKKLNDIIGSR